MAKRQIRKRTGKKAQITIFLIVGILLVVTAGLIYYFSSRGGDVLDEAQVISEQVPVQAQPVQRFVEKCIYDTAREAIERMGRHGGYIDPQDDVLSKRTFVYDETLPYESDGISIAGEMDGFVPYYWYLQSRTDCVECISTNEQSVKPDFVEEQINTYINRELEECLGGFTSFEGQGFDVVPGGQINANTVLTEKDVAISVTYPLTVIVGESATEMTRFGTRLPVRLREIIRTARRIALSSNQINFLEENMLNIISLYSGASTDRLPPLSHDEMSFTKRFWIKSQVEKQIKSLLVAYTPVLRVDGTDNSLNVQTDNIYETAAYNSMNLNVLLEPTDGMDVNFLYFDWPIHLEITPNQGEILTAYQTIRQNLLLAAPVITHKYKFNYDMSWPVLVQIRTKDAFFDNGYTFMFALEGNIRQNHNLRDYLEGAGSLGPYRPVYDLAVGEAAQEHEYYSGLEGVSEPTVPRIFCNEDQKKGGLINLTVNSESKDPIEVAKVTYGCGMYASCPTATLFLDEETNKTTGEFAVPVCMNGGYLKIEAPGHTIHYERYLTTLPDKNQSITVKLKQTHKLNLTIKKQQMGRKILYRDNPDDWKGNYIVELVPEQVTDLSPTDKVIIRMIKQSGEEEPFPELPQIAIISPEENLAFAEIELSEGRYEISANLFSSSPLKIEPEKRCFQKETVTDKCKAEAFVPEQPGVNMDVWVSGGLEMNDITGFWVVTDQQLEGRKNIELKVMELPRPVYIEDLSESSEIENYTSQNIGLLAPAIR